MSERGTQLASREPMTLARAGLLLAVAGCILPPPIEEGIEVRNQPPRILVETLSPPPSLLPKIMSVQCPQYRFFANVQDPDRTDTVYWRYFVDYPDDPNPLVNSEVSKEPPDENNPGASRLVTFTVSPDDERLGPEPDKLEGAHTVELLISDRPFLELEREPLARVVEEDGLTDSFSWALELIAEVDRSCNSGGGG